MAEALTAEQKKLVEKNLELAHFLARMAEQRNKEELDIEELVSVAYQGLVQAALRFDASLVNPEDIENGKAFSGYARRRINGAILDWQREVDHVQRTYRQLYKQLQTKGYTRAQRYSSNMEGYAEALGVTRAKLDEVVGAVEDVMLSLNMEAPNVPGSEGQEHNEGAWLADEKNTVEGNVVGTQIVSAAQQAYMDLPEFQKVVIALRWYAQTEFQVIAAELGTSLLVVREAHTDALLTIHRAMARSVIDK